MSLTTSNIELATANVTCYHPTHSENINNMNLRAYDSLDQPPDMPEEGKNRAFIPLVVITQVFGVASVILSIIWCSVFGGGFDWSNPATVFNYHPVFMILGMIFCFGDAMLMYRVFKRFPKLPVKAVHAVLMLLSLLFSVVGLKAVFDSHNMRDLPNMYSLHSWIGIVTVSFFALQWVIGLVTFLVPSMPTRYRVQILPLHTSMGVLMFFGALVACISGITEKNLSKPNYGKFPTAAQVSNVMGLCLIIFCGLAFYLVHRSDYKRVEPSNDEQVGFASMT